MIYIIKQEGLYQNKVNSNIVSTSRPAPFPNNDCDWLEINRDGDITMLYPWKQ